MSSRRDFLVRFAQAGVALSAFRLQRPSLLDPPPPAQGAASLLDVPIGLDWRMLGPFRGGRVAAVSGVPPRPEEFYFGPVTGAVWKPGAARRSGFRVLTARPA